MKATARRLSETPAKTITDARDSALVKRVEKPGSPEKELAKTENGISDVFHLSFIVMIGYL